MGNFLSVPVTKVLEDGTKEYIDRKILKEYTVHLICNGEGILDIDCTNFNLKELVVGRLFADNKISCFSEVESIEINEINDNEANAVVSLNETINEIKISNSPIEIDHDAILNIINSFSKGSKLHNETTSTHSCYLAVANETVFETEDISRHNAVDKAVGYMLINNLNSADCILYSSGRVPLDMIEKVGDANIPILVAKALPTDKAIQYAKDNNIVLIARARNGEYEIFNQ